jgi:hypothetical protein
MDGWAIRLCPARSCLGSYRLPTAALTTGIRAEAMQARVEVGGGWRIAPQLVLLFLAGSVGCHLLTCLCSSK